MNSFVDDEGTLRILVANSNRLNGTSMYSVDSSGRIDNVKHTINTQYVRSMALWKLDLNLEWHIAIANKPAYYSVDGPSPIRVTEPKPMISFHSWRHTYFDQYQILYLPHDGRVNKLQPMNINGQEFLIVAMDSNKYDNYPPRAAKQSQIGGANSLIYQLDFSDGNLNWVHKQNLETELALDASSFIISHKDSLRVDYYIAVIGQPRTSTQNTYPGSDHNQANSYGLIIYKYLGDYFMQVQFIPAIGVTKLDTLTYGVGNSYVVIALLDSYTRQIKLFHFNGLQLTQMPSPPQSLPPPSAFSPQSRGRRTMDDVSNNIHLFMMQQEAAGSNNQEPSMLAFTDDSVYPIETTNLDTDQKPAPPEGSDESHAKRSFIDEGQELFAWCKSAINSIMSDNFQTTSGQLQALPRIDQARPIELNGDLIIDGDLHVSNLLYTNRVEERFSPQRMLVDSWQANNISQTFQAIENAHRDIDQLKRQVDQVLVDDGTVQDVYVPLNFERVMMDCLNPYNVDPRVHRIPFAAGACPQVGEIRTTWLNGRNISDIRRQALLTGRSMHIGRDVRFEHLILYGDVEIRATLNGLAVDEIVFGRGQSSGPILGHKNLRRGLYSSANLLVDYWNGVRVDRQTTLTSTGEQRINANLNIGHVVLDDNGGKPGDVHHSNISSRIELLNGLHVDTHLSQIALASGDNNFEVPLLFDELILDGAVNFPANSRLSNIDIEELWLNTMFKHSHQNITAPMEFSGDVHVSYGGDVIVSGPVNGVMLDRDNVMMRNLNYRLPNRMIFDGDLSISHVHISRDKFLNGIRVVLNPETQQDELSLLMDGGYQFLSGDKILDQIHLGGQSQVSGLINGHLNLSQLYRWSNNDGEPFRFPSVRLKGNDIRMAEGVDFHLDLINGISANDICSLALRVAGQFSGPARYDRLRFDQDITFRSLRCASINGFSNLNNSFLMRYGNQHVPGTLRLVGGLTLNTTVNIQHTFNDLQVGPLRSAVSQAINESRTGHKDIYGDFVVDDLYTNTINDLPLSSVLITKSDYPQYITAPMVFDHLDIENVLIVHQNLYTNLFNGLNVSDILRNTLQYDTDQVIYNHVELQTLYLLPGANLNTKSFNGHDLQRLYSDAVLVDVPQQILAPKTFRQRVEFADRVYLKFGIDELSENELRFNLLLQSDEMIDDDLEFHNQVTIMRELEVESGVINDHDLNQFVDTLLYENQPGKAGLRITGNSTVRFKDVNLNNLVVTGTIQGLDVSRDALQRSDNVNGTYNRVLREQRVMLNNQRLMNQFQSGQPFSVSTNYQGGRFTGPCHIHSCPLVTSKPYQYKPSPPQHQPGNMPFAAPLIQQAISLAQPPKQVYGPFNQPSQTPLMPPQPMALRMPIRPIPVAPTQMIKPTWHPNVVTTNMTLYRPPVKDEDVDPFGLVELPKYLEHQSLLKAQAIEDLASRVNKYLLTSLYYEIVQKHPHLGPLLHAGPNPIVEGSCLLFMKSTTKVGEPCLQRGQTIAVVEQRSNKSAPSQRFAENSKIQETSNPIHLESLVVRGLHYLFILDTNLESSSTILVYIWNTKQGFYDLKDKIPIDGYPTSMKAFVVNDQLGCLALADPRLNHRNHPNGAPVLYCQRAPMSPFSEKSILNINHVFELDIVRLDSSTGGKLIIAALSQHDTELIGDLIVGSYDVANNELFEIAKRRTVRPLKLHFMVRPPASSTTQLVVTEAITSNDKAFAMTRIFTLDFPILKESQVIKDNQFYDIQSVLLDSKQSLLFMQSAHSISMYAPTLPESMAAHCEPHFRLIQKIPTKGANRFLVFNDIVSNSYYRTSHNVTSNTHKDHFLVLSRDNCETQQYSTQILKSVIGR